MPKVISKQQAKLFGYIAGGGDGRFKKFSPSEAKERLRGVKIKNLPARKKAYRKMLTKRNR